MERFQKTERKTFSRLVQCCTGHAHTGEYYRKFIPMESMECPCGTNLQTHEHVVKSCRLFYCHRHTLGIGQHAQMGRLMDTIKGIRKLITFIKRSGAFDKPPTPKDRTQEVLGLQSETAVPTTGLPLGRNPMAALSVAYI